MIDQKGGSAMKKHRRFIPVILAVFFLAVTAAIGTAVVYMLLSVRREQARQTDYSGDALASRLVSGYSGSDAISLQLSATGGDAFSPSQTVPLTQVNSAVDSELLLPVSTADLRTFFYCSSLVGSDAEFEVVSEEEHYYHGQVYIRAAAGDGVQGTVSLYFYEDSDAPIFSGDSSDALNRAARLGLTIDDERPTIYSLSEDSSAPEDQVRNTYLDGVQIQDGKVLTGNQVSIYAVDDPSVSLADATVRNSGSDLLLPDRAVMEMELNQIYKLDVYYYLEGCDPDCSNAVTMAATDMHLGFFGYFENGAVPTMYINVSVNGGSPYPLESYVEDDCILLTAVYDASGTLLDTKITQRSSWENFVNIDLRIAGLPSQYTVKVMTLDSSYLPIAQVLQFSSS